MIFVHKMMEISKYACESQISFFAISNVFKWICYWLLWERLLTKRKHLKNQHEVRVQQGS